MERNMTVTCNVCGTPETFTATKRYMLIQQLDASLWHVEPTADGMGHVATCGACHGSPLTQGEHGLAQLAEHGFFNGDGQRARA